MRKLLIPLFLGIALLVLAACGSSDDSSNGASQESTDDGKVYSFRIACINRSLLPCQVTAENFAKTVEERSNGKVTVQISSFPELGLSGPDTLRLVGDGTLGLAEIYSGYVGGDLPIIDVGNLWGLAPNDEAHLEVTDALYDDMKRIFKEESGGIVLYRHFYSNQYFWSKDPLVDLADYKGKKIRQHSTVLGDMLSGLGADGQFVAFSEVYTALERGILDAGITASDAGFGQRWYEVVDYLVGPIVGSIGVSYITMNGDRWNELPANLQAIILEEGQRNEDVKMDLLLNKWRAEGEQINIDAGMEVIRFTPEVQDKLHEIALEIIIPNWVNRLGGADTEGVRLFNEKVAPIVGVKINPDGSASETN